MSTYNDQSDYELMELLGLKDLRNARLILARITYIDRIAKTATITIPESCPELENEPLDEVPFFYHCEYSTGTVADLEKGYKAFLENDYVYCLFVPENGDQVKQFYIVGHADIRSIKLCLDKEYLFIKLTIGADLFVTIYETESASKINLSEFENLPGSPAKPTSFPCFQSAMIAWYNYNFIAPTVTHYIEGSLEFRNDTQYYINYPAVDGSGSNYSYTGVSYGPIDFNTGNEASGGHYTVTQDDDIYNAIDDDVIYNYHSEGSSSGIGKYPVGGGNYRAWWKNKEGTEDTLVREDEHMLIGTIVSKSITYNIWSSHRLDKHTNYNITLTGDNTQIETANFTYAESFSKVLFIDFSPIGRHNFEARVSWSISSAGTLPTNILGNFSYRDMTETSRTLDPDTPGTCVTEYLEMHYWSSSMYDLGTCCKLGQYYVYSLIGGLKVEEWELNNPDMNYVFIDETNWPYPGTTYMYRDGSANKRKKIYCIADAGVTDIYGSLTQNKQNPNELNLLECLSRTSASKSAGLNNVINELFQHVVSYYNYTLEEDINDLIIELAKGPSAQVVKKKTI